MHIRNKRLFAPLAALAVGIGLVVAIPALPAVSQSSPPTTAIQIGSSGTLQDKGAVVLVPVRVVCPAGDQIGNLSVQLSERSGNAIAQGAVVIQEATDRPAILGMTFHVRG